jgi:hypothetical protein
MKKTETSVSSVLKDETSRHLEAPTTISADDLEAVAGGTAASLRPGLIGPTSGMVAPPEF